MLNQNQKKKGKWILLATLIPLLFIVVVLSSGLLAVFQTAETVKSAVMSIFGGDDASAIEIGDLNLNSVTASELYTYYTENPDAITEEDLHTMKLSKDNFLYILDKCIQYESLKDQSRSLTITGIHEYTVTVETTSETPTGDTVTYASKKLEKEDVKKEITVSNEDLTDMFSLDWKMLYLYSVLASIDQEKEQDFDEWLITRTTIDKVYTALTLDNQYAYDIMQEEKTELSLEECEARPHTVLQYGDSGTEEGSYYFCIPRSMLLYSSSGYTEMYHTVNEETNEVTGLVQEFNRTKYEEMITSFGNSYTDELRNVLAEQLDGVSEQVEKFDYYYEASKDTQVLLTEKTMQFNRGEFKSATPDSYQPGLIIPDGFGIWNPDDYEDMTLITGIKYDTVDPDSYSSCGEAAVAIALSRLNWGYSQPKRMQAGYWDCSSLVGRCYSEAGTRIPASITSHGLFGNAATYKQYLNKNDMSSWKPGDVLLFSGSSGNHCVLYCGGGMCVHAKGTKYGTVYESVSQVLQHTSKTFIYVVRPYIGLEGKWGN